MKWPWTQPPVEKPVPHDGFEVGQVVQHKVSGMRAVIVAFEWFDEEQTDPAATVSVGFHSNDEFTAHLAELEAGAVVAPRDAEGDAS